MVNGEGTCPFLNSTCIKSDCELWHSTRNCCVIFALYTTISLLNDVKDINNDIKNNTSDIKNNSDDIKNNTNEIENKLDNNYQKLDAIKSDTHDIEEHTRKIKNHAESLPAASGLVNEHFNGQDLDGDNRIYLKDFVIEDSDTKPLTLKNIEEGVDISSLPKLTWEEYFNWYPNRETDPPPPLH